jgi:Tetratrico peptide repeat
MDQITEWEQRLANLWASIDDLSEEAFLQKMECFVAELPANSAVAAFEQAGSLDSTGHSDLAVPLYRRALELGLEGQRRRRASSRWPAHCATSGRQRRASPC